MRESWKKLGKKNEEKRRRFKNHVKRTDSDIGVEVQSDARH